MPAPTARPPIAPTTQAPATAPQSAASDRGAPISAQDAPAAVRELVSKLKLQMVVYSDVPAERLVFINNQKYLEGSTLDGGLRLESIAPDSAVVTYQGQRYVLRQ